MITHERVIQEKQLKRTRGEQARIREEKKAREIAEEIEAQSRLVRAEMHLCLSNIALAIMGIIIIILLTQIH
tara:strand:+ start:464 stop:679 length:216 start_codon:yes stop_codon:yes gene_type:complete